MYSVLNFLKAVYSDTYEPIVDWLIKIMGNNASRAWLLIWGIYLVLVMISFVDGISLLLKYACYAIIVISFPVAMGVQDERDRK